jgi:hypothetical protein
MSICRALVSFSIFALLLHLKEPKRFNDGPHFSGVFLGKKNKDTTSALKRMQF